MLTRVRRPAALLALLLAACPALAACGDDEPPSPLAGETAEGFDAVEISGDVGRTPEVDWKAQMEPGDVQTETVVEGQGAELAEGDTVLVNFYVGNGFTHTTNVDTFGAEHQAASVEVGAEAPEPQQAIDVISSFIAEEVEPGMRLGTRVAATGGTQDLFGELGLALTEFQIGNEDGLLVVFDLVSVVLDGPKGKSGQRPAWAPRPVITKGEPSALDFGGVPEPTDELRVATLIKGTGPAIQSGDTAVVDYLGQVYGGTKPFDESYTRDQPLTAVISEKHGSVVKGWSRALEGVTTGSRVLIQVPPRLGYGKQGNAQAGVKGTDTMYFVVDVLGAA